MQLKTLQTSLAAVSRNKACGELRPEAIDFFFFFGSQINSLWLCFCDAIFIKNILLVNAELLFILSL